MALKTITTNLDGSGVQVNLGTSDSAYIAENVVVSSTDTTAIVGSGTGRSVYVDGIVASSTYAINLGIDPATDRLHHVVIGETGSLKSFTNNSDAAVWIYGYSSVVENEGKIWSTGRGVYMNGSSEATTSEVINSGRIEATDRAVWHGTNAAETLEIFNSGIIKGGNYSIISTSFQASSIEKITNTGKIIGTISLDAGNDVYNGVDGRLSGTIFGGAGNDLLRGGIDNDTFQGEADNDKLYGGKGNDLLSGDAGNDALQGDDGNDTLLGGTGVDTLYGGLGKDTLTGGSEKDTFVFKSIKESTVSSVGRDTIKDFSRADAEKIDLKLIDANSVKSGDQAFKFIDTQAFHKAAGELRYEIKSGDTFISGDINGDGKADFSIALDVSLVMKGTDFIL